MSANSSIAGYLSPAVSPALLQGEALMNFIQEWVVGVTGLAGTNVRPRWQPEPPNIPAYGVDWCAIGITRREAQVFNVEHHIATGGGKSEIRNHEKLELLASFYGPNADGYASNLREGMGVAQNREILFQNNMGVVAWGEFLTIPEMVKERWLYRVDFPFTLRRQIVREFSVLNLSGVDATLNNAHYSEPINI